MEDAPFSKKVTRESYNALIGSYKARLFALQQEARSLGISCVVVTDGAVGAIRKKLITRIMTGLDPQSVCAYRDRAPGRKDRRYPLMRRHWLRLPARGEMTVFERGWYRESGGLSLPGTAEGIRSLEGQMSQDGIVIKLLLRMPRKGINKALRAADKKRLTKKRYRKMLREAARLQAESASRIPWTVLAARDMRSAEIFAFEAMIAGLDSAVSRVKAGMPASEAMGSGMEDPVAEMPLDRMEPGTRLKKKTYRRQLKKARARLRVLMEKLARKGVSLTILAEATDKDKAERCIRHLARAFDPDRAYITGKEDEAADGLYPRMRRYYRQLPPDGRAALFLRSWYTQAMGVDDTCAVSGCSRADIAALEQQITGHGGILVKLWLQETGGNTVPVLEGQEADNPAHVADCPVCEETLLRTDTAWAPWTVIDAGDKRYTRVAALHAVIAAAAAGIRQKRR